MKGALTETFKLINVISNYGKYFWIILLELEIYCLQSKSANHSDIFAIK